MFSMVLIVFGAVTVMVYVFVVLPLGAVTTTVMVLAPPDKLIDPDAVPDVTLVPFTVMVAFALLAVGVTVTEFTPADSETVYDAIDELKLGLRVPADKLNPDSVASPNSLTRIL